MGNKTHAQPCRAWLCYIRSFVGLLVLTIMLIGGNCVTAHAAGGTWQGITWDLTDGVLTVRGDTDMPTAALDKYPWSSKKQDVTKIVVDVQGSIGEYAFALYPNLESIEISNRVNMIGEYAFTGPSKLASIIIPGSVKTVGTGAFGNNATLTSVTFEEGITEIQGHAFTNCSKLKEVRIPGSVESIGTRAFYQCNNITTLELSEGLKNIDTYAFYQCSSIQAIKIPGTVAEIGANAFDGCSGAKLVELSEGVQTIRSSAFKGCSDATVLKLPEGLQIVEKEAFKNCESLLEIKIPSTVTSIGQLAFDSCLAAKTLELPKRLEIIESYAFRQCQSLTRIEIPNTVKTIKMYAFYGCVKATELVLPSGLETIGKAAFAECLNLCVVKIPSTVTLIEKDAFKGCAGVKSLELPANFSSQNVFGTFPNLIELKLYGVPTIEDGILPDADNSVETTPPHALSEHEPVIKKLHRMPTVYGAPGGEVEAYADEKGYAFIPFGPINSTDTTHEIKWDYKLDENEDKIIGLSVNRDSYQYMTDQNGITLYIPKSIDGHEVVALNGLGQEFGTLICGQEHEHEDDCYEGGGVRDILGSYINGEDEERVVINELHLPDTVTTIGDDCFASADRIGTIYNYSKENQEVSFFFSGDDTGTLYTYSTNSNMRKQSAGYKSVLFDGSALEGKTGDLIWKVNLDSNTLTLSGKGKSADYKNAEEVPFAAVADEIYKIVIEPGVTYLGNYLFAELPYLHQIENRSSVIGYVGTNTFENSGMKWTYGGKTCTTYVNAPLYDAMVNLNAQTGNNLNRDEIQKTEEKLAKAETEWQELEEKYNALIDQGTATEEELFALEEQIDAVRARIDTLTAQLEALKDTSYNEFSFIFRDTTASCGTELEYTYTSADRLLEIHGTGVMTEFADPNDVPWRPVNDYIRKIVIGSEVTSISNNAFNRLPNLRSVYNHGKNQVLVGGNDSVFDPMERYLSKTEYGGSSIYFKIPELDLTTAQDWQIDAWYADLENQARGQGVNMTVADFRNWLLTCNKVVHKHSDSCYMDGEFVCTKAEHTHTEACYNTSSQPHNILPGEYYIPKESSSAEILAILKGEAKDMAGERYIVPVYTFGDENADFSASVPPESDGYRLMAIFQEKGQCGDDLTYYVSLDGALIIEGTGPMWDFTEGQAPWIKSAKEIRDVEMPDGMTSIGNYAFETFESIVEFDIPKSVTRIGTGAFINCYNLYSFDLGAQYEEVGSGLFAGCHSLRVVNAADNKNYSVTDGYLLENDTGKLLGFLREHLYENAAEKKLFTNPTEYQVPDYVKIIGDLAYYETSSFYNLTIPENVTEIGAKAFYGGEKIENIDLMSETLVTTAPDALDGCGTIYSASSSKKYAILYMINESFAKAAEKQGYTIVYHDMKNIKYLTAAYAGEAVMVGQPFDPSKVQISIVYDNGDSESIYGTDKRVTFPNTTVNKVGENLFVAVFNDGYGQILETNQFVVEGVNSIGNAIFTYTGPAVWYGEEIDRSYVLAKLVYADGSTKTVNGNATYSTPSGNKYCIELSQYVLNKEGDQTIVATYKDQNNVSFSGNLTIRCQNYITGLKAEYSGEPVELAAGVSGLELDQLRIDISWSDGTVETIDGNDPRVNITSNEDTIGANMIFEFTINDRDRYGHVGSFACPFVSNIENVTFEYVGGAITNGMVFSIADVQLTLHYSDGKVQKVMGDTVSGLEADDMIVHTSDGLEEVLMTYTVGAAEYTGTIYVPGKIRIPVKLIVVKRPLKTVYQEGDAFDPTGMIVNCIFDNGISQNVTQMVQIDTGGTLNADTKTVTLIYEDSSSGYTVRTNMTINVNQYQKELTLEKQFKEQYEISRILFRSKKTEDAAGAESEEDENLPVDPDAEEEENEEDGKWQDITPLLNNSIYDEDHDVPDADGNSQYNPPVIKAGYGFELKVFTRYQTNRAGTEFQAFLKKAQWDAEFEAIHNSISHDDYESYWKYLNDVYPQAAPTASPDLMYFRTTNGNLVDENGDPIKNMVGPDGQPTDFIIMEKTNRSETEEEIDEGEWYDCTKVFEFPLRAVIGDEETRRVYVSPDAANPNQQYTEYSMQIISPAWYGYDPEPYFEGDQFHYSTDEGETYAQKSYAYNDGQTKYLHVCAEFVIRVVGNDDLHTHILE